MADRQAAQIPDLRSLLSSRGRGGLRARGRARRGSPERFQHENTPQVKDTIVQRTDHDAAASRMSAVELGYLEDPYARLFATAPTPRRFPIMNRGTYIRTSAIDKLVNKFLDSNPDVQKQIISLGAGTDTRYFRILSKSPRSSLLYHELDFAHNTGHKIATIQRTPGLLSQIKAALSSPDELEISEDATVLTSPTYNIHAIDLRNIAADPPPSLPNISSSAPTLLISECCLIYLTPEAASRVLTTLTQRLIPEPTPVAIVLYEPIKPNDSFGRTMVSNLATRGIVLETLQQYPSLAAQRDRFRDAGFVDGQGAAGTDFIYDAWVSSKEKERVAALEMMDELEEWLLLAKHYCVAWGWRNGGDFRFQDAWTTLKGQTNE
ncbi:leucine carboxyl methyltransferase 1 [Pseudovirgaria hyperparasitica]|uniref:Leucine carboxyl methyltransferase 1 n=1 Tax=Pseudovirgaria hyperparasitica TaxID=470096 RepID=A0A6A6VZR8_9PEZI|nr:leucine carboxyl methyltransferase 1 [Pseudovirgaria hyperparasitica]KAF2755783.1 leucine carboxyl methyltransferase 1 [Pseudovirgaria hyperparasitica]